MDRVLPVGTVIANVALACAGNTVDKARANGCMNESWQRQVEMQGLRISKLRLRKVKLRRLKQRRVGMENANKGLAKAVGTATILLAAVKSGTQFGVALNQGFSLPATNIQ